MNDWRWPDLGAPSGLAVEWFAAAVASAEPGAATELSLEGQEPARRTWILSLGKAANGMALGAVRWLAKHGIEPAGGVAISHVECSAPHAAIRAAKGDHPVPGEQSLRAAHELERAIGAMRRGDTAVVLLSGGASSLVAAPSGFLTQRDVSALSEALLASGAPIGVTNTIRRRVFRWAGGRLADALSHVDIRAVAISDVPGDHARLIGSGPLTGWQPEDDAFGKALEVLQTDARRPVEQAWSGGQLDLSPDRKLQVEIAASNSVAFAAAADAARRSGWRIDTSPGELTGEAAVAGRAIGERLRALPRGTQQCVMLGGETTVTLGSGNAGVGGRSQELALSAARALDGELGVMLLAAGTDGRDGPTDAAGALVDGTTWGRIPDGDAALSRHDSHAALEAAGALLRTGPTGTNVMDLVIALRW